MFILRGPVTIKRFLRKSGSGVIIRPLDFDFVSVSPSPSFRTPLRGLDTLPWEVTVKSFC